jgi:NADPH-dependent 2,4-dienoyl-CoA reductase/sulfur reductase-like enzyme
LSKPELLIIGGGPAGMNAAIEAASHGVSCCIVDEARELGGQIYRAAHSTAREASPGLIHPRGDELRSQLAALSKFIEVRSESVVWGISDGNKVAVGKETVGTEFINPQAMIMATGAYEYIPPFPGWTLPGVMTPGAAQILAKTLNVLPGKRVVVAGTGPLLYVVASQLVQKGINVIAVLEATPRRDWLKLPFAGWRAWELLKEGFGYLRVLRRAGVPVHYGRIVTRAEGDAEVSRIYHAPVDRDWFPDRNKEECLEVDTLCVGYGLQSRNYLAQLAGCEIEFNEMSGCWVPKRDRNLRTSKENIYAVGDGAGVAGSKIAELEGQLAGLGVAASLGHIDDVQLRQRCKPLQRELDRIASLQNAIAMITRVRPGLTDLVDTDTIVCRCEEVRWKEAKEAIEHGGQDFRTLKVMTRLGMGMCQARFCWPAMARMVASHKGCDVSEVGPVRPRPPIRPVRLDVIAEAPQNHVQETE